tara:strand:+ start:561 stop:926 length:366 start_codon:yes stop_codon:yes gene_type:complete
MKKLNKEKQPYVYTIKQKEKVYSFLCLFKKTIYKTYKFDNYKEAYLFALHEQIKIITVHIIDKIKTTRRPFQNLYTLKEFQSLARLNPRHYLGGLYTNKIDVELYYFYLINSNQLTKLKKY